MPAEAPIKAEDILAKQQGYYTHASTGGLYAYIVGSTISKLSSYIAWEHNSGEVAKSANEGIMPSYNPFNSNRQFIKLEKSFLDQLKKHQDAFQGRSEYLLQERMKISADAILKCSPDKISLEVTEEGSVFYTFLKDDARIYFQHFLIEDDDDMDEAIISIYKGDANVLNYAGSLIEAVNELHTFLIPQTIASPELVA